MARHIRRMDASARRCGSACRDLNDRIVGRIAPGCHRRAPRLRLGPASHRRGPARPVGPRRSDFRHTEIGPQGPLEGMQAIVAVASGGPEAGAESGFVTGYMRQVPGVIGVADVSFATTDRLVLDAAASLAAAEAKVRALTA